MNYHYRRPAAQLVAVWADLRRRGVPLAAIARLYGYSISCIANYTRHEHWWMRRLVADAKS